jgi:phosphatidylglycerol:prolipoprotein diacylglycerol transferase
VPWAIVFPYSDGRPRHPSQIYEALSEGLLLFCIMAYSVFKWNIIKIAGRTSAIFLILYSIFRIIIENWREPDVGLVFYNITMGQILSIPILLFGIYLLFASKAHNGRIGVSTKIIKASEE